MPSKPRQKRKTMHGGVKGKKPHTGLTVNMSSSIIYFHSIILNPWFINGQGSARLSIWGVSSRGALGLVFSLHCSANLVTRRLWVAHSQQGVLKYRHSDTNLVWWWIAVSEHETDHQTCWSFHGIQEAWSLTGLGYVIRGQFFWLLWKSDVITIQKFCFP